MVSTMFKAEQLNSDLELKQERDSWRLPERQQARRGSDEQLVPLDPSPRQQLGFLKGHVDDAFFGPLVDDELERWGA